MVRKDTTIFVYRDTKQDFNILRAKLGIKSDDLLKKLLEQYVKEHNIKL